jgi:hypothetical protein
LWFKAAANTVVFTVAPDNPVTISINAADHRNYGEFTVIAAT